MILTVTLNAALDVTYRVPRLQPHASHRVSSVVQIAGGKGVNVASVLTGMGVTAVATGLCGGPAGQQIRADLDARGIRHDLAPTGGEARRALTVVSDADGDATVFNEPGPQVSGIEWQAFLAHLDRLLAGLRPTVVVASGSLPPGLPDDAYAAVVSAARAAGAAAVVDASGPALAAALPAGPDLVKPNRDELLEVAGEVDPVAGAGILRRLGARDVLVSCGAEGLVLVPASEEPVRAWLTEPLQGNPTGAGDAAVAAVAAGLAADRQPAQALAEAVAWSAAAVLHPLAGHVRHDDVDRLLPLVRIDPSPSEPALTGRPPC